MLFNLSQIKSSYRNINTNTNKFMRPKEPVSVSVI